MPLRLQTPLPRHRRSAVLLGAIVTGAVLIPAASASAATSITSLVAATKAGQMVDLSSGTYAFSNFGSNLIGVDLSGKGGLTGSSPSATVVKINPYSSTKAGSVPTTSGSANQLYLMLASGAAKLADFTLQGTAQGHLYNGLKISNGSNASVKNVTVTAVPGAGYNPPQETFAINDQRSTGSVYSNITEDGTNIGATGFAANSSTNVTISDSSFVNNVYSAGVALWQTKNAVLTDVVTKNNRTGLNFERTSGTITVTSPTILNESNQDIYIGSDQASAKIIITNPVYSGHIRIRVPATYRGVANKQLKSDIHVLVNGVDKTSSIVTWI